MERSINFINGVIQVTLPSKEFDSCLYDFVKLYKVHKHSCSYLKYGNIKISHAGMDVLDFL